MIWLSKKMQNCKLRVLERDYESCEFLFPIYYVTIVIIEKVKIMFKGSIPALITPFKNGEVDFLHLRI